MNLSKQPVVIHDPVKRRRTENRVEVIPKRQSGGVCVDEAPPSADVDARFLKHRRRSIETDDEQVRGASGEIERQPACAAADVQDTLAARRGETLEYAKAPAMLRVGHAVIPRGIPI
jgi:hypothetical protein